MRTFQIRLTAWLLAAALIFGMIPAVSAAYAFSGGAGTVSNPYLVSTAEDLQHIASYSSSHFRQINDISLEGIAFSPICTDSTGFTGSYDGNGYAISGLSLSTSGTLYLGLFGVSSGTVKNVTLTDAAITARTGNYLLRCGALVGLNKGILSNNRVEADLTVTATQASLTVYTGGVCGYSSGSINGCTFSGSVTHKSGTSKNTKFYTGGIAGYGTVRDSENHGSVTVTAYTGSTAKTGGITSFGSVSDCKNTGSVTVTGAAGTELYSGGIVGDTEGTVRNCLNEGDVRVEQGEFVFVGGIAGFNTDGLLTGVKNTGSVYGSTTYTNEDEIYTDVYAGGIAAYSTGDISYAENTGDVFGESTVGHTDIGGVVGYIGPFSYSSSGSSARILEYAKNSGTVIATSTGGEGRSGGIAATAYQGSTVRYCCNTGTVKALNSQQYNLVLAGGLVGCVMYGTMMQSCNHGDIYIDNKNYSAFACGLSCSTSSTIADCWNEGNIHSDYKYIGLSNYGTIAGLFWDSDTSCVSCYNLGELSVSQSYGTSVYGIYGIQGGTDHNSVRYCYSTHLYQDSREDFRMSEAEACVQDTYAGFNFDTIWAMDPDVNGGHPYLRNLAPDDARGWYLDPDAYIPVTGLTVTPNFPELRVGESLKLTATVSPANATNTKVTWSSEDSSIVSVTSDGTITGQRAGGTWINATIGNYISQSWVEVTADQTVTFSGGSGTASDPYIITTPQQLQAIRQGLDQCYALGANIDLTGFDFTPIGDNANPFTGTFSGYGYTISGLTLTTTRLRYVGLFGYSCGKLNNVTLKNCTLSATSGSSYVYCGGVVGYNEGDLSFCSVDGAIFAKTLSAAQTSAAGGVAGASSEIIRDCDFSGSVHAEVSYLDSYAYAGGIIGCNGGAYNCTNSGSISASGAAACDVYAGGILGYASGNVYNCYNSGSIDTYEARRSFSGGITGSNQQFVESCKNVGSVHANTSFNADNVALYALAGGITGSNFSTVRYCRNFGEISSDSTATHAYAGGIVGYNNSGCTLEYSVNYGDILASSSSGGESRAGGIASSSYSNSTVRYCCNNGNVSITDNPFYWSGIAGGVVAALQYGTAYECCSHGDIFIDSNGYEPEGGVVFGSATDAVIRDCYGTGNAHCAYRPSASHNTGYLWGIFSGGEETQCSTSYFTGTLTNDHRCERHGLYKEWGNSHFTVNYLYAMNLYSSSGTPLTAETAVEQSTYRGFDFTNIWAMDPEINNGMPYLRRVPTDSDPNWYDGPEDTIPVTAVTLNQTTLTLDPGQTETLRATLLPANTTDNVVTWSSGNETVAAVTSDGTVTAVGIGTTTVTATAGNVAAVCTVTVRDHTMDVLVISPTCTAGGYTEYYCTTCDHWYREDYTEPTGHTPEITPAIEPTCWDYGMTEGSICIVCDEILVEQTPLAPLAHHYIATFHPATCLEQGFTRYCCDRCGDQYDDDPIPALGHDYVPVVTPPGCETEGFTTFTCSHCGDSYQDSRTAPLGHSYVPTVTPPTCTTEGVRTYVCEHDRSHTYTEPLPATGHQYSEAVTTNPTCTTAGIKTFTCQNDPAHTYTETLPALGHTDSNSDYRCDVCNTLLCTDHQVEAIPAKPASCTESGLTAGSRCTRCAQILTEQQVLPALGHTVVTDPAVAATCTTTGLTEGSHCSVCSTVLAKQQTLPAAGHTSVTDPAVAPTCTDTGLTAGSHCAVCNAVLTARETISALGHDWDAGTVAAAPTCTGTGLRKYVCSRNASHTKTESIPAAGHADTDKNYRCDACGDLLCIDHQAEELPEQAPTCSAAGLTAGSRCKLCGQILTEQKSIPATGHTVYNDPPVPATCTTNGLTKGSHCTVCGTVLTAQQPVQALGHRWDAGEITTSATCVATGIRTFTCRNDKLHTYTETIPMQDHTAVTDAAVAPTCTATGLTEGSHCSVCSAVLVRQEIVPATGHSYTSVVTPATCTEQGFTTFTCKVCSHSYRDQVIAPLTHQWDGGTVTVPATCTTEGLRTYTCLRDKTHTRTETLPATGHSDSNRDYICDSCGSALCTDHRTVTIPGKAATCLDSGLTAGSKCALCGQILIPQTVIPAKGHTIVRDAAVAPTCTATGLTEGSHCSVCSAVLVRQEIVSAAGHTYTSAVTAPTCEKTGFTTHTCTVCQSSYTDAVSAALGHSWNSWVSKDDASHSRSCQRPGCGSIQTEHHTMQEVIENGRPVLRCGSCGHSKSVLDVTCKDQTVTVSLGQLQPALIWAASYHANGQLDELFPAARTDNGAAATFAHPVTGKTIRLFFLNADYTPMFASYLVP